MLKEKEQVAQWIGEMAFSDSQIALKSLYQYYFERLLRFVSTHGPSYIEAEEIVSDTFLALWNNRKTLLSVNNPDAYIFTVTRNKTISYLRSQQYNQIRLDEFPVDFFACTETTPEDALISKEEINQLNDAINTLPHRSKMVFKLIREDKMKYKDVATILDISVKTVETHIGIAIRKLREILSKQKK